jgi:hypothetical protein
MYKGIRIDNLSVFDVNITGLYIKLDKKLFVEADTIKIDNNVTKSNDYSSLNDLLDVIPYIHMFFSTIIINNIEYGNEKIQLTYQDEVFYVNSSVLTLKTKIQLRRRKTLGLDIQQLLLKDIDVELSGKTNIDFRRDEYAFDGRFRIFDISGNAKIDIKDKILAYNIISDNFASPKLFMDNLLKHVKLNDTISNWIYGYTKGANYKILSLNGKIDIVKRDFYLKNISALAKIDDVNITFNPEVPPAHADEIRVKLENGKISFLTSNPTSQGENITKVDVLIYNLIEGKSGIKIDIGAKTLYNDKINKIIKTYAGVDIPVRQKNGKNDANVSIDVKFADVKIDISADVAIKNADLEIGGVLMHTPHANIRLKNSVIDILDSRVQYDGLFDISVNGTLNTSTKEMNGSSFIHSVTLDAKNRSIVTISNISTLFDLKAIDGGINIYAYELESNLTFADTNVFIFNSLSKLYPYSQMAQEYGIKNGRIVIRTNDFKHFKGYAALRANLPLSRGGKMLSRFAGSFEITENSLDITANNKTIILSFKDEINLTLNGLDVNIDMSAQNTDTLSTPVFVKTKGGHIILKPSNTTILADEYNVSSAGGSISLELIYKNSFLSAVKESGRFDVSVKGMKSEFLNALANKEFFAKGSFDFYAKGESENEFLGVLNLKETRLKDFLVLNNLIAFLNTIPSLATFSDPRYSTSGFPVKNGTVEFIKSGDYLFIQKLFLEGYSSDIEGSGYVSLETGDIHMDLKIFIMKSLSNIIDKIPLMNYIILDDDGTIKIQLSVRGTLDNPKIETNLVGDTLMSPFNMIKRIFELPSHLLGG